jgi:hypothetical protein
VNFSGNSLPKRDGRPEAISRVVQACIRIDVGSRAGIGLWPKSRVVAEGYVRSQSCTSRANCDFAPVPKIRARAGKFAGNSSRPLIASAISAGAAAPL